VAATARTVSVAATAAVTVAATVSVAIIGSNLLSSWRNRQLTISDIYVVSTSCITILVYIIFHVQSHLLEPVGRYCVSLLCFATVFRYYVSLLCFATMFRYCVATVFRYYVS
jgi:hypothetical protein